MALMDSRVLEAITGPVPRGWKGGLAAAARERLEWPLAAAFLFTFHALLSLAGSQQRHYISPGKSLSVPAHGVNSYSLENPTSVGCALTSTL